MTFPRLWRWLIVTSFVLGLVVGAYTLVLAKRQTTDTQDSLRQSQVSACEGAKAAAAQWNNVMDVLADISERSRPGSSTTPTFLEFRQRTAERYAARATDVCKLVGD